VAVNCSVAPALTVAVFGVTIMLTVGTRVTVAVAVRFPLPVATVAVIVTVLVWPVNTLAGAVYVVESPLLGDREPRVGLSVQVTVGLVMPVTDAVNDALCPCAREMDVGLTTTDWA
jgi:hypothetical protein